MEEALRVLWRRVFGDPQEYIDLFFRRRWPTGETLVLLQEGAPVSMLTLLPLTVTSGDRVYEARYIYAVGTDPDHRARGYSGRLLQAAQARMTSQGVDVSMLVPASTGLFDFYAARGFRTEFFVTDRRVTADRTVDGALPAPYRAELAELRGLRDDIFSDSALYARWDRAALAYQDAEAALTGGEALAFGRPAWGYALCYRQGRQLLIKELAVSPENQEAALAALARHYDADRIQVRLRAGEGAIPFGMTQWYRPKGRESGGQAPPYLSLVLD